MDKHAGLETPTQNLTRKSMAINFECRFCNVTHEEANQYDVNSPSASTSQKVGIERTRGRGSEGRRILLGDIMALSLESFEGSSFPTKFSTLFLSQTSVIIKARLQGTESKEESRKTETDIWEKYTGAWRNERAWWLREIEQGKKARGWSLLLGEWKSSFISSCPMQKPICTEKMQSSVEIPRPHTPREWRRKFERKKNQAVQRGHAVAEYKRVQIMGSGFGCPRLSAFSDYFSLQLPLLSCSFSDCEKNFILYVKQAISCILLSNHSLFLTWVDVPNSQSKKVIADERNSMSYLI